MLLLLLKNVLKVGFVVKFCIELKLLLLLLFKVKELYFKELLKLLATELLLDPNDKKGLFDIIFIFIKFNLKIY